VSAATVHRWLRRLGISRLLGHDVVGRVSEPLDRFFTADGITVEKVLMDNGFCYRSHLFDAALPDSARYTSTRPHHSQTNGKIERYNRTLNAEFADTVGRSAEHQASLTR